MYLGKQFFLVLPNPIILFALTCFSPPSAHLASSPFLLPGCVFFLSITLFQGILPSFSFALFPTAMFSSSWSVDELPSLCPDTLLCTRRWHA